MWWGERTGEDEARKTSEEKRVGEEAGRGRGASGCVGKALARQGAQARSTGPVRDSGQSAWQIV
jgi:hypothetical protein